MSQDKQDIYIVAGPTASGKSARALELADQKNGVIINCDSLQIYSALPILTAQPSSHDLELAEHLLYSHLHPNIVCSAGNWREMVEPIIHNVLNNNQTPIICGGTGLYIRSLTDGLSPIPDIPEEIRAAVVEKYQTIGASAFYDELEKRDPIMAKRFHANHKARIIRAMEVLKATGKSLAQWQEEPLVGPPAEWNFIIETIMPERETLYKRCNDRFTHMLQIGALEEVEDFSNRIKSKEINDGVPITKALGFRALEAYINGDMSKEDAIERSQTDTRQYAKRQMTWLRNQM